MKAEDLNWVLDEAARRGVSAVQMKNYLIALGIWCEKERLQGMEPCSVDLAIRDDEQIEWLPYERIAYELGIPLAYTGETEQLLADEAKEKK
jgi:hypothetical protein